MVKFRGNTSNVSDWVAAGRAGARAVGDNFAALRQNAPDYQVIGEAAMKARSAERQAVTKATGDVAQAGLAAKAKVENARTSAERDEKILDAKLGAKRFAGIVGGLGTVAVAGMSLAAPKDEDDNSWKDKYHEKEMALLDKQIEALDKPSKEYEPYERTEFDGSPYEYKPDDSTAEVTKPDGSTAKVTKNTDSSSSTSGTKPPTRMAGGGKVTATAEQAAAFNKIYNLAVKDGRAKFPEIVAAQAMHETGWLSPNLKSVYNSSGGKNPFGQTGDRGYGTNTRSGDSNGWSLYPSLAKGVSDHITLWHDTNNHKDNYNAHDSVSAGLSAVIPAYSPNADPANQSAGFTEGGYIGSTKEILRKMGYDVN